jgi:hypothetical protein
MAAGELFLWEREAVLYNSSDRNEVIEKLYALKEPNLYRVDGFIKCLIAKRESARRSRDRRRPLLAAQKENDQRRNGV